jgi:hypothetical protein
MELKSSSRKGAPMTQGISGEVNVDYRKERVYAFLADNSVRRQCDYQKVMLDISSASISESRPLIWIMLSVELSDGKRADLLEFEHQHLSRFVRRLITAAKEGSCMGLNMDPPAIDYVRRCNDVSVDNLVRGRVVSSQLKYISIEPSNTVLAISATSGCQDPPLFHLPRADNFLHQFQKMANGVLDQIEENKGKILRPVAPNSAQKRISYRPLG